MSIIYDTNQKSFHLTAKNTSYILQIYRDGYLAHVYFGRKLRTFNSNNLSSLSQRPYISNGPVSLDSLLQEYPSYGTNDFRNPAYSI